MMLIQELLHRAFSTKRMQIIHSEAGYQLAVSYFGISFTLASITTDEVKEMQRAQMQVVS